MLNPRPMDSNELSEFLASGEPTTAEFFKANISEGFDNSLPGLLWDQIKESNAAGFDSKSEEGLSARTGLPVSGTKADQTLKTFTQDEWKKSEFFREGVEFKDGWSEGRAKYLAESYDERKERELILSRGNQDGLLSVRGGIGMVGQVVGSLPDPINLIPFGGAASKTAKIGEKIIRGAVEGGVGNLAVSAMTRPYYEKRGVDSDWTDYMNDLWIGGVMGGGFAGAGHLYSRVRDARAEVKVKDRATLSKAADAAIDANLKGEDLDLTKVQGLQESFDSVFDIPEVQRSRKVQDLQEQLTGMGFTPEDARTHISPIVAQAEAFARDFNMSVDEFLEAHGPTFQKSTLEDGRIVKLDENSIRATELIDSELQSMAKEIEFAEKGGQRIFNEDGSGVVGTTSSSFPSWYKDAGIKNKEHLAKVLESKSGPVYSRLQAIAEDRLMNGYETPTSRSAPSNEYLSLIGKNEVEIPVGPDGEPLFKKTNGKERGAITFGDDGKAVIHLFENADQSTIIHETGHLFLNNLEKFSAMEGASPQLKADFDTIKKWMGVESGKKIETKHHEKFARGFEQYLREGKAPRRELQSVFSRFKDWLTSLYKTSKDLKANLSDDARAVYDRLLTGESRPKVEPRAEVTTPEPRFKEEAEVMARTSEIETMVETTPGLARPEETVMFKESLAEIEAETRALDEITTFFQGAKDDKALMDAANKAGISKTQFEKIIDEFNERLQSEDEARLGIEKLIERKKAELAAEAAELKRQAYLSLSARTEVMNHVKTVMDSGASAKDSVLSILEGASHLRGVEGAGKSVDGSYMALAQSTSSKCFSELRKVDARIEKLFEDDIQFNENVIKEMIKPGSTGDDVAKAAGEILSRYSDELRTRANLAGASIGKLEGHVPRTHDVEKMVGKMDEWVNFMSENLDPERTFKGMEEADKKAALVEIYASLVSDNHGVKEVDVTEPLRRVPRNIAKKMGESRSLHFKSPEAELAYLKQFGQGDNILQSMASHYEGMSKKIALMERLGPNPENTIAHVIQTLHDDVKAKIISGEMDSKTAQKILDDMGDVNSLKSRDSDIGHAMMQALGEVDGTQGWFKNMSRVIRAVQSLSKLGSALLSQPTDFVHAVNERRILTGRNEASLWVETFKDYFSRATPEMKEVLDHVGIYVDSINYKNFNRFDADNINNKLQRANDWMYRWTGQNWHVKHSKQAAGLSLAREMGANISKSWNDIHPGLKETLVQYGSFNESKWEMLRKAEPLMIDGKAYYHPGMIEKLTDDVFDSMLPEEFQAKNKPSELPIEGEEVAGLKGWEEGRAKELKRARFKLEMDLKTFFVEESRNAAPEPDAKVRRIMSFGSKSGTKTSEAIKLLTQFKTFAFVNWDRSIKGKRMMKNSSDYGGIAHHAVSTLALGYISTVLKDLAKGLEPADPSEMNTWGRAAFQSGGLGIMGDFLQAGISSRSGADALTSLMGPTFSTVSNFTNLAGKTVRGDALEDGAKLTSQWIDFGRSLAPAPFSSMWYTRAAMDHLIWQNLKETLEPGSIRRSERRLKKEYNQKYLISPRDTQWLPELTR